MQAGAAGWPAKRARLEANKRRDALDKVGDKYAYVLVPHACTVPYMYMMHVLVGAPTRT